MADYQLKNIDYHNIYALIMAISDGHTGSTMGIMPDSWTLVDGSVKQPNDLQRILLQQWYEDWARVKWLRSMAPGGCRTIVVDVGDQIDGNHHGTTQLVTLAIDEQERMRIRLVKNALMSIDFDKKRDSYFALAGTDAHEGQDGSSSERIIRGILDDPDNGGIYSKQVLRLSVNGVLFEFAHQGVKPNGRIWSRGSNMHSHLRHEYLKRLEDDEPMARYMLYGHYHQFEHNSIENQRGETVCDGFVLPTYSFKSYYAQGVAPHAKPDIGMWLGIVYRDGTTTWRCPMLSVQQDPILVL